ncbi:MlaD family protein [Mycolicibacter hiberniae]|uniref:Mammalian cell entry protein n=1 Tax=Mycolicibacter hiberniae TaxID=29314 RepID=A0A7I7X7T3_9MYCO|nr:MlaD family protein [Mycolicibacter hiberniae]MCV7087537.1 MCE family protein [Mycolicibacter hiberniae]ORV69101.1 mammalian cell entry protein [Mycolicibacter hiberniae]BBZ24943.1 mammalian cell entry protein [Mycolicibacter hiberniae]
MANSLDTDGRGPSEQQLLGAGIAVLLVIALTTAGLLAKSTGMLNSYVRVIADLINVGDGLPAQSDVKYHGLLVGSVTDVIPAAYGKPNYVHINLKPEYAKDIPGSVTARVVPSNVFAVSSIQLVDSGDGGQTIRDGAHIAENGELSTVIFQTTVSKLRDILAATGRGREDHSLGILAAVGAATDNRRVKLLNAGAHMSRLLDQLNGIVATEPGPSTVSALLDATHGLQATAPDLVDALHQAVEPMRAFAEKRAELASLVTGGQHTVGVTRAAFDNHIDQLIQITHDFTPVVGVLANNADKFVPIFTRVNQLNEKFFENLYHPKLITKNMRANLSFTPLHTYTRADCPQYGEVKGPSCFTAPMISVRSELPENLLPQNYRFPAGLEPPPGTEIGPDGNLHAVGPPVINPNRSLEDTNPPLPWWTGPFPRVPGTADPLDPAPPPPPSPPIPVQPHAPEWRPAAPVAPASYGGNVGPVGSQTERTQLGLLTGQGGPASVATQLLLGPVARGNAVSVSVSTAAEPDPPKAGGNK